MLFYTHGGWIYPAPLFKDPLQYPLTRLPSDHEIEWPSIDRTYIPNDTLKASLEGRRLLLDELFSLGHTLEEIHRHVEAGLIRYTRAFQDGKCQRCGNDDPRRLAEFTCARCNQNCRYCRNCIMMGRISQCSLFLTWQESTHYPSSQAPLQWQGQLSPLQEQAAKALVDAYKRKRKQFLLWAVTGAGKTESLFLLIEEALKNGEPVLLAAPRTDVVLELAPRMKAAFPSIDIAVLYGGSEDRYKRSQLTIATTHQTMRLYQHYPLVIIDEVDAFPYSDEKSLHYAVKQAARKDAFFVFVTATPSKVQQKETEMGKLPFIRIPSRFHGYPLPVPAFTWIGDWKKGVTKERLPIPFVYWLSRHVNEKNPLMIFVAEISIAEKVAGILQKEFRTSSVAAVYAEDEERREKVRLFREKKIDVLVTTTILERGVTIENVQVGVLGAEEELFDARALVQIAGRAGRSKVYPDGEVRFFHYGRTSEMIEARKQIIGMNEEGKRR